MGADAVTVEFSGGDPRHRCGIRAGDCVAAGRLAREVDDYEVIPDAAVRVAMHPIEGLDDRPRVHFQAGLFLHLAAHGINQRFTKMKATARQRPLPQERLTGTLDDQRAAVADDDGSDTDHGLRGVFSGHMKSHTEYLTFNVPARVGFENITPQIEAAVRKSGVAEGLVLVNAMHITASVFINDDERGLHQDYAAWLETLAPFDASPVRYAHNRTGEDNADAHMKRQIMGREVVVAITKGALDFGPWEQIFYGEFDGKRAKRVLIKVIGD